MLRPATSLFRIAVAVLSLSACPSAVDLASSRVYPCDPDAGAPVCPAQMRCGLDGRCHDLGAPAAYTCRSDSDCEAQWRCGLEGTCHARDVASDYVCRGDSDCELDWRCGLDGRCRSRDVAGPFACRASADCDLGWRCGREGVCHAPGVAATYACASDDDCEAAWRCGFGGFCLDASADALGDAGYLGPVTVERLSPAAPDGYPDLVAADGDFVSSAVDVFATIRGGVLTQVARNLRGQPYMLDDGGEEVAHVERVVLDGGTPRSLAAIAGDDGHSESWVLDDTGLLTVSWSQDAGLTLTRTAGDNAAAMRFVRGGPPLLLAPGLLSLSGPFGVQTYPFERPDGGPLELFDAVPSAASYLAATDDGLLGDTSLQPQPVPVVLPGVPHPRCTPDAGLDAPRVVKLDRAADDIVFMLEPPSVIVMKDRSTPAGCGTDLSPLVRRPLCQPCAAGFHLSDFVVFGASDRAFCVSDAGDRQLDVLLEADACATASPAEVPLDAEVTRVGHALTGVTSHAGAHGQVTAIGNGAQTRLLLDHPDVLLYLRQGAPAAIAADTPRQGLTHYRLQSGVGLVATLSDIFAGGTFAYAPSGALDGDLSAWVACGAHFDDGVAAGGIYDFSETAPRQRYAFDCLDGGFTYYRWPDADGGEVLVSTAGDQLLTAQLLPPPAADAGPVPLSFEGQLAVERALPVRSLASVGPGVATDAGPGALIGYALTDNSVHALFRAADQRWRSSPVPMPENEWLELWSRGAAARLGYRDGQVYALGSRVPIGGPLPGGQAAVDFESVCGATWALATGGLYRLGPASDGGVIGEWRSVDLGSALAPPLSGHALERGRLVRHHNDVYLVTGFGTVVRLRVPEPCP